MIKGKASGALKPLNLRSEEGKALLKLTREQFSFWEGQVASAIRRDIRDQFIRSHALYYWLILSKLATDGDDELRVSKKVVERDAIPNLAPDTVRKYLEECNKLGLTQTINTERQRYSALTKVGERVLVATLRRWIVEFAKVRRDLDVQADVSTPHPL